MTKNSLTPHSKRILHIVQEFGCMSLQQINYLFKGTNPNSIKFYIMALYKMQYIRFSQDNEYIMMPHMAAPDLGAINALWVILNNLSKEEIDNHEIYCSGESPVNACFFKDGDVYQVIDISKYNLQALDFFVEKEHSKMLEKNKDGYKYIITVTEKDLIDRIADANPDLIYNIALIDYDNAQNGIPIITYYSSKTYD